MTRSDHHWEDARVLATLETMTDSIMNLRQMKMSGLEPTRSPICAGSVKESTFAWTGWKNSRLGTALSPTSSRSWT